MGDCLPAAPLTSRRARIIAGPGSRRRGRPARAVNLRAEVEVLGEVNPTARLRLLEALADMILDAAEKRLDNPARSDETPRPQQGELAEGA